MSTQFLPIVFCVIATMLLASCTMANPQPEIYQVRKLTEPMQINANWDKPQWRKVKPLDIKRFLGDRPEHRPRTQAKLLYDDKNVYIIFRVEDKFIRAVSTKYHEPVWTDSCVEFFFTPGTDIKQGYFNIETNCIGTILSAHQTGRGKNQKQLGAEDLDRLEIAHSLPKQVVDPEIVRSLTWTLEYRLPIEILQKYHHITRPKPGVKWLANFYKCGDKTSHPHWLTWSIIASDRIDFHRPEYFGTLEFVD